MFRPSTSLLLISTFSQKKFQRTLTLLFRHSKAKKTIRKISLTSSVLFLVHLLIVSFLPAANGVALSTLKSMDTTINRLPLNGEQSSTARPPCKNCRTYRQLMSIQAKVQQINVSSSKTPQSLLLKYEKFLQRICEGLSNQKCRHLQEQISQSTKRKFHRTEQNGQVHKKDNFFSNGQQAVQNFISLPSQQDNLASSTNVLSRQKRVASGDRRSVHMYCKTNFILEITRNGRVVGSRTKSPRTLLQVRSVKAGGIVSFYSAKTGHYLAMNRRGRLYGTKTFSMANCAFKERLLENLWSTYSSYSQDLRRRKRGRNQWYVAIGKSGRPRKANKVRPTFSSAQFLLRPQN